MKLLRFFVVVAGLSMMFMFSGCVKSVPEETPTNEKIDMEEMPKMDVFEALTETELNRYKAGLTLGDRVKLAAELAYKMPLNGMKPMRVMFPDLVKTKTVGGDDPMNMLNMGAESWFYSEEADLTIVVCDAVNTPIQIIKGKNPTEAEVMKSMEMLKTIVRKNEESKMAGDRMIQENLAEGEKPQLMTFSEARYEELLGKRPFIIYFHADWCPICFVLEEDIKKGLSNLPKKSVILQADYDNSDDLKMQYGVERQATLLFFDGEGNVVGKELNPNIERIIELAEKSML